MGSIDARGGCGGWGGCGAGEEESGGVVVVVLVAGGGGETAGVATGSLDVGDSAGVEVPTARVGSGKKGRAGRDGKVNQIL